MVTVLQKNQLTPGKKPKLDLWGALLLMLTIATFVFSIDKLGTIFQHPFLIVGTIIFSIIAGYLFLFFAKRTRDPLISFHLFQHYLFRYGLTQRLLMSAVNGMLLFILSIYFVKGLHYSIQIATLLYFPYTFFARCIFIFCR